jgi:hypothetical protein
MLNFSLFLSSLGIIGADIFLFVKIGTNVFSWVFLGLGLGLLGCSLASFKLRKSIHLLGMYLMVMFGLFFFMLIATILLLVQKQGIVEKVIDAAGFKPEDRQAAMDALSSNLSSVSVAMIIFSGILLGAFITGWMYRNSTINRTDTLKENLVEEHRQAE